MEFDDFKEYYGWGDDVTEKTTIGEALDKTKLSLLLGDNQETMVEFREFYDLSEEVNGDTLYGEIRETIDKKAKADRIAEEKEEKSDEDADNSSNTENETDEGDSQSNEEE